MVSIKLIYRFIIFMTQDFTSKIKGQIWSIKSQLLYLEHHVRLQLFFLWYGIRFSLEHSYSFKTYVAPLLPTVFYTNGGQLLFFLRMRFYRKLRIDLASPSPYKLPTSTKCTLMLTYISQINAFFSCFLHFLYNFLGLLCAFLRSIFSWGNIS